MHKIKIENDQFLCPMVNLPITERGRLNYGICRICKNNILGKFVNDYVYCSFGSSSGGSSGDDSGEGQDPNEDDYTPWEDYQG